MIEAVGLRAMGNMQGNEVRGSQEVVERRGADTEHIFNRRRQWLALGIDDVHLEGAGASSNLGTDLAKANQAQGLAAHLLQVRQFHPLEGEDTLAGLGRFQTEIPVGAGRGRPVGCDELFRQGEDQGHRQLGHRDAAAERHDGHSHTSIAGRVKIEPIRPAAILLDDFHVRTCGQDLRRDWLGAGNEGIGGQ